MQSRGREWNKFNASNGAHEILSYTFNTSWEGGRKKKDVPFPFLLSSLAVSRSHLNIIVARALAERSFLFFWATNFSHSDPLADRVFSRASVP
jgi:hypothetical protein